MPDAMLMPTLLRTLVADPGRPRLTWYGPGGERIELSGHVLDNWVTKTANLLVEEFDAGPGTRVLVDLPPHWRTVVWAMAAWRTGAHVVLDPAIPADVVVTHRPTGLPGVALAGRPELVVVALPALARSFDGDLPPGAVDANGAVMTYGDVLTYMPEPDPGAEALSVTADGGTATLPHSALRAWSREVVDLPAPRLLVTTAQPADDDGARGGTEQARVLAAVLSALASDGSVVLCDPEVTAPGSDDGTPGGPPSHVLTGERVTHVLTVAGAVERA